MFRQVLWALLRRTVKEISEFNEVSDIFPNFINFLNFTTVGKFADTVKKLIANG